MKKIDGVCATVANVHGLSNTFWQKRIRMADIAWRGEALWVLREDVSIVDIQGGACVS